MKRIETLAMKHTAVLLILSAGLLFLRQLAAQNVPSRVAIAGFTPDAARLKTGRFTYHDLDHGNEVGTGIITIRKLVDSGYYYFSNDSAFASDFAGFRSQRWEAVATPTFEPISARLAFVRGSETVPVFDLRYRSSRVTGFVVERKGPAPGTKRPVDTSVPANTVDQRIDWAAVLAGDLGTGKRFEFNVYDPGTGVSRVTGLVGSLEQVRVAAGTFRAYRIIYQMEKAGRTEHYQMLASQDLPHVMLGEEFPNGVTTELTQITGPGDPR
jgi:hypothetical protein